MGGWERVETEAKIRVLREENKSLREVIDWKVKETPAALSNSRCRFSRSEFLHVYSMLAAKCRMYREQLEKVYFVNDFLVGAVAEWLERLS